MPFRITIYCCSYIFGEGIKRFIEDYKLSIDTIVNCSNTKEMIKAKPDLLITDFFTICNLSHDIFHKHKVQILLIGTGCLPKIENARLKDFISHGLVGILSPMTNPTQLKKALKSIISGELWLDRARLQDIVSNKNNISSEKKPYLNEKEIKIVKMICNGHSNKEIMKLLNMSENSVKSHLNRIYKKTGVSDRLQLALFALNQGDVIINQICQLTRE